MATEVRSPARNLPKRLVPHALWQVQVYALVGQSLPTPLAQQLADQDACVNDETHPAVMNPRWLAWSGN